MKNLTTPMAPPHGVHYQQLGSDAESGSPQNPFVSETQTLTSHDSSSDGISLQSDNYMYNQQPLHEHHLPPVPPPRGDYDYSSPHAAYPEYGQPQQYSLNDPSRHSSGSLSAMGSTEFDRYPNRISSAAPSIASGAPLLRGPGGAAGAAAAAAAEHYFPMIGYRNSTLSDKSGSSLSSTDHEVSSNDPFVVNADFSPFGGYPASSFPLHLHEKEADDYLHNPDPILDAKYDRQCKKLDRRGWGSIIALMVLVVGAVMLFVVYPVLTFSGVADHVKFTTKVYEVLTNYQYSTLGAIRTTLVDPDTPKDAMTRTAKDGSDWQLVFSDEFNKEGRTFYDGDDQFWTAQNFHYASTNDLEWYSPQAVTTENGTLVLRLDAYKNHNLFYQSGMVQSWNKFCFTQGMIEVSALLPGSGTVSGLWPGIWTLGNLARAGYMATSDGVWPYSYNECDAGITPNQSSTDGISYLPGQRLNKCTCPGHDHPNEGTGRGAPEIDALEAAIGGPKGAPNGIASQSVQVAPFDIWYMPNYDFIEIYNRSITAMNTYCGGPFQEAISGTTTLNTDWYEKPTEGNYQSYGFEYLNDDTDGYIRWFVGNTPSYTLYAPAIGPNGNVGARQISKEPMSIVLNLGISNSWAYIDWNALYWPSIMRIDYVRVYQPSDAVSTTCDPPDYPTYDYIKDHWNAYQDANLTSWAMAGYAFPPTQLLNEC